VLACGLLCCYASLLTKKSCIPHFPTATQSNSTLQSIDVTNNPHMDKSWNKLLNHVTKGKPKG